MKRLMSDTNSFTRAPRVYTLVPFIIIMQVYSYPVMPTEQCNFLILYIHSIYGIIIIVQSCI